MNSHIKNKYRTRMATKRVTVKEKMTEILVWSKRLTVKDWLFFS